jgi:hypothetical protein
MMTTKIPRKVSFLKPVLPLVPKEASKKEEDKSKFVTMELKSQAGTSTGGTYKKHIVLFNEGTPQEWIDAQRDIAEVWKQNNITQPDDRMAIIRTLLRGETLTTFDASIEEQKQDPTGTLALTMDMVTKALAEVSNTIFPHRALEIQKQWMRKHLKKPSELSIRLTSSALSRMNNCLPFFPGGDEGSKFTQEELLKILECSLPFAWRQKFDYDGYVPTDHNKAKLISSCEAIERKEESQKGDKKQNKGKNPDKAVKKKPQFTKNKGSKGDYYCTHHGKNPTHDTANCFTLKNKAKADGKKPAGKGFSNKGLRKEINLLAKSSSKAKVLDLYATVIAQEKAKLHKKSKSSSDMDTDSDNSHDMAYVEYNSDNKRKDSEVSQEELTYLAQLHQEENEDFSDAN